MTQNENIKIKCDNKTNAYSSESFNTQTETTINGFQALSKVKNQQNEHTMNMLLVIFILWCPLNIHSKSLYIFFFKNHF